MQLLSWLLLLVAVTLFPFDFRFAVADLLRFADSPWPNETPMAMDFLLNVLLFVPFGAWLQRGRGRQDGWQPVWRAGAAGLLISVGIEVLQGFLPRRDMSVIELLSNSGGAFAGAWMRLTLGPSVGAQIVRIRASASPVVLPALMAALAIAVATVGGVLQTSSRLSNWSSDYPLLMGNERHGERPWRGRVIAVDLTDAATPPHAVRGFAAGVEVAPPGRRVAAFRFSGPAPYSDLAGIVPPLRWTAQDRTSIGGAVFAPGLPWLQSDGPAAGLAQRLQGSNAFTLRVICASDDLRQAGPARILSNSAGVGLRNFTVGQQGADLIVRLRTPHTGLNGSRPEVRVPAVFTDSGTRDILVTYDGSSLLVAVARSGRVLQTDFTPGSSLTVVMTSLTIEADELPALAAVFIGTVFFAPGVVFGTFASGRRRMAAGGAWLLLFVVLFESALCLASGRAFSAEHVVSTSALGALAFALGVLVCPPQLDAPAIRAKAGLAASSQTRRLS